MFKMSNSCENHRHSVLIAIVDAQFIFDRSAGLNHGFNTLFVGNFYTIWEGEKSIGSHYCALQIEIESFGFVDGLLQCIYTRCLSSYAGQKLSVFHQNNRVRFGVFYQFIGKQKVFNLLF